MVKILVFDTETTGLPPYNIVEKNIPPKTGEHWHEYERRIQKMRREYDAEKQLYATNAAHWDNMNDNWPYIVQLSYIAFDTGSKDTIVKDVYIELPADFTMPEYLETAHPITRAAIEAGLQVVLQKDIQEGIQVSRQPINDAIDEFMVYFREVDIVVGHNVNFDVDMLLAECKRTNKEDFFNELFEARKKRDKFYCTASKSKNLTKICYEKNCPEKIFKTPKLNEVYYRMFGYAPNESALHNALIDVVACLRVFYRLYYRGISIKVYPSEDNKTPICGIGAPDIYLALMKDSPNNPIIKIIEGFTPPDVNPEGVGDPGLRLQLCKPIEYNILLSEITKETVDNIKKYNDENNRLSRWLAFENNENTEEGQWLINKINENNEIKNKKIRLLGGSKKKKKTRRNKKKSKRRRSYRK